MTSTFHLELIEPPKLDKMALPHSAVNQAPIFSADKKISYEEKQSLIINCKMKKAKRRLRGVLSTQRPTIRRNS